MSLNGLYQIRKQRLTIQPRSAILLMDLFIHTLEYLQSGPIYTKWKSLGLEKSVVGYPTSDTSPAVNGQYNPFQNGGVWWFKDTGTAYEVHGPIKSKWADLGYEKGVLGEPTSDVQTDSKGIPFSAFQHGAIYNGPNGIFEINGDIYNKWVSLGSENSALGYPISDVQRDSNNVPYSNFQKGAIFDVFPPNAREVHGPIYSKWLKLGGGTSAIGYPSGDAFTQDVSGYTFSITEQGFSKIGGTRISYMIWTPYSGEAVAVTGPIEDEWVKHGLASGCLAAPVTDESILADGITHSQDFIHGDAPSVVGDIQWNSRTNVASFECVKPTTGPTTTTSTVEIQLNRQNVVPPDNGTPVPVPYATTFPSFGTIDGNLIKVQNPTPNPFNSNPVTLAFLKPGHSSLECNTASSIIVLTPGSVMSSGDMQTLFGSSTPKLPVLFLACISTPQAPITPDFVSLDVTYTHK